MKVKHTFSLRAFVVVSWLLVVYAGLHGQGLESLDEMSLEDFNAQVLQKKEMPWVVDFWASWCKPCIYSIPELAELEKKWNEKGVSFVSVSWDKNKPIARETARRLRMTWKQVFPPDIRHTPFLDKNFKHKFLPTIFIVYPNGKVKKVPLEKLEKKLEKIYAKMG